MTSLLALAAMTACGAPIHEPAEPPHRPEPLAVVLPLRVRERPDAGASEAQVTLADSPVVSQSGDEIFRGSNSGAVVGDPPPGAPLAGGHAPEQHDRAAIARRGRRAYQRLCAGCHELGPSIVGRHVSRVLLRRQVREGRGRMRAIPAARLSDHDLDAIATFLERTARRRARAGAD